MKNDETSNEHTQSVSDRTSRVNHAVDDSGVHTTAGDHARRKIHWRKVENIPKSRRDVDQSPSNNTMVSLDTPAN
jgi:hypothetical protein